MPPVGGFTSSNSCGLLRARLRVLLCLIWFTKLSSQFQKYFAVLMDMLEHIGDVLPRFQAYETLFSSSTRLMQSLSNAYLEMIKFCTSVKAAFQKARKSGSYSHIHSTGSIMVFYTN